MKLFSKYNRINLLTTVIIFLLASIAFFVALRYIIINQVDDDLKIEQNEIETAAKTFHHLPEIIPVKDQYTSYAIIDAPGFEKAKFTTVEKFDAHEQIAVREISFNIKVGEQWYLITVAKSLEGTDDLIQSIIVISICTILLILATTSLINRIVLRRLWQPFYNSLRNMREFKLGSKQQMLFSASGIEEFDVMNVTLQHAFSKAEQDYLLLREFTENASHELQTPLAIMRSKMDVLIQDENLSQQQSEAAQGVYDAIQRLTRINQSLLLLAKIENNQFADVVTIDLKQFIQQKLKQFHELWLTKNIVVTSNLQSAGITINATLADILFNNLFSNATKHNINGGIIDLQLQQGSFKISNSGQTSALDATRLFSRFYKTSDNENHGLGLSIAKQICEVSHCNIVYNFNNGMHTFSVNW